MRLKQQILWIKDNSEANNHFQVIIIQVWGIMKASHMQTIEMFCRVLDYSQVEKKSSIEKLMADLIKMSRNWLTTMENNIQTMATNMQSQGKKIQSLEMQMSQVATALQTIQKGKFPSCSEKNPKE